MYNRELVQQRLSRSGGSLGFVLICLAAISGYIRADEATKGYYTNRLRMLAAAGVGAAGVIIYQMLRVMSRTVATPHMSRIGKRPGRVYN